MRLQSTIVSRIFIIVAALLPSVFGSNAATRCNDVYDMQSARQYCDQTSLEGPEGIWEFTEDETSVLIRRKAHGARGYDIIVVSTPDCRLKPGDIIGNMERSAKKGTFKMHLYTSAHMGVLSNPRQCAAEYSDGNDSMLIHPQKIRISVRTMWFLPKFWRSLRVSFDNPAGDLPPGLCRVYPRIKPDKPIYL